MRVYDYIISMAYSKNENFDFKLVFVPFPWDDVLKIDLLFIELFIYANLNELAPWCVYIW